MGTSDAGATEAGKDEVVRVDDRMEEAAPPPVEFGTNTAPLIEGGPTKEDPPLEGPVVSVVGKGAPAEDADAVGETNDGVNGAESGEIDTGNLLPVPIGALIATVVGSDEGAGALFLTVESNHALNQRS